MCANFRVMTPLLGCSQPVDRKNANHAPVRTLLMWDSQIVHKVCFRDTLVRSPRKREAFEHDIPQSTRVSCYNGRIDTNSHEEGPGPKSFKDRRSSKLRRHKIVFPIAGHVVQKLRVSIKDHLLLRHAV